MVYSLQTTIKYKSKHIGSHAFCSQNSINILNWLHCGVDIWLTLFAGQCHRNKKILYMKLHGTRPSLINGVIAKLIQQVMLVVACYEWVV